MTFSLVSDRTTIKKDIQLLFTFEDVTQGNAEDTAWKVSNVSYSTVVNKVVPVKFNSTLAFALASKTKGNVIVASSNVNMKLRQTVDVVLDDDKELTFDHLIVDDRIKTDQISVWNNAGKKVDLSVGFVNGSTFSPVSFISGLLNNSKWLATYKPNLKLYTVSDRDSKVGQVIDTVQISDVIFTWELAVGDKVPDGSRWVLYIDPEDDTYKIKPEAVEDD
ncbi:hypothetical protein DXG01_011731 [Tephrocybe rancida]|nr:hypothetical protein DXG01_011731 [Tephrocybe rancida]